MRGMWKERGGVGMTWWGEDVVVTWDGGIQ